MAHRRGNYSMLSALMILVLSGFGAISVDLSLVRLGASQAQDIADAASHAAIVMYREGRVGGLDDEAARALGEKAAQVVANSNKIVGSSPTISSVVWGDWNTAAPAGTEFSSTSPGTSTTAVQVYLGRSGSASIKLPFASILGRDSLPVRGAATSASRNVEALLSIDITGSWDKDEFQYARQAAVAFYDVLAADYGPLDKFGVVVWFNNYAFEYVPFMKISDAEAHPELARDLLLSLNVGNYAGVPEPTWDPPGSTSRHVACKVYGTAGTGAMPFGSGSGYYDSLKQRWSTTFTLGSQPGTGCHPSMPRYYQSAEGGTDHHTGLMLTRSIFKQNKYYVPGTGWVASTGTLAYRAVVMLTDGEPIAISAPASVRASTGTGNTSTAAVPTATSWTWAETNYPETWQATAVLGSTLREYRRDTAHSLTAIQNDTKALAANMASADDINIWVVSFRDDNAFLDQSSVGDGWYTYVATGDVDALTSVFEDIARSLPTAIVK